MSKPQRTPYDSVVELEGEDQCSHCRFKAKENLWYCALDTFHTGQINCLKTNQWLCPISISHLQRTK